MVVTVTIPTRVLLEIGSSVSVPVPISVNALVSCFVAESEGAAVTRVPIQGELLISVGGAVLTGPHVVVDSVVRVSVPPQVHTHS